jgi:hypothetical protein
VATNARLALLGGGAYLKDRVDANSAAPGDLVNAVSNFANTIEQLGVNYLIGAGRYQRDLVDGRKAASPRAGSIPVPRTNVYAYWEA